jgi:hypothetical protein
MSRGKMLDLDEAAGIAPEERYTYLFDMNSQQLDHVFVTEGVVRHDRGPGGPKGPPRGPPKGPRGPAGSPKGDGRRPLMEHLHLNTWQNNDGQVSDHDPSVAKLNLCGCAA